MSRESDPNYQLARGSAEKLRAQVAATRANLADVEEAWRRSSEWCAICRASSSTSRTSITGRKRPMQFHTDLFAKLKQAEVQLNLEKVSAESRFEVSPVHVERSRNRSTLATSREDSASSWGSSPPPWESPSREARRIIAKTLAAEAIFVPRRSRPFGRKF